jgi:hypothetical protein
MKTYNSKTRILIVKILLFTFIAVDGFLYLSMAEQAKAQAAADTATTAATVALTVPISIMADIPRLKDKWYIAIMRGIAYRVVDDLTKKFIDKITEKYKIRNYLYYDQILTNYYLSNFIQDKVSDPDLQTIYNLMNAAYVTGNNTGHTGQPNPNNAVMPRLKKAISDYYLKQGGIPPDTIYSPPPYLSDSDYFDAARGYFSNQLSFTEQNLNAEYGRFQTASTTAAQLEIIVGNSMKAGRIVGGTCNLSMANDPWYVKWGLVGKAYAQAEIPTLPSTQLPNTNSQWAPPDLPTVRSTQTPSGCAAVGGRWRPSALDETRSFIDNPSYYINQWLQAFISRKTNTDYDPNNFWFAIGSSLGGYIMNKLTGTNDKILVEQPGYVYVGMAASELPAVGRDIDLDGDGVADAHDYDADGTIDICAFGGEPPTCEGSKEATNPSTETPENESEPPADALEKHPSEKNEIADAKEELEDQGETFLGSCGSFKIINLAAWNIGGGIGLLEKPGGHRCEVDGVGYSVDVLVYTDGYIFDVLGSSSDEGVIGENRPMWLSQPSVDPSRWAPAIDPDTLTNDRLEGH